MFRSPVRFESATAVLGAVIGAVGAILLEPIMLAAGTAVVALATAMRLGERHKIKKLDLPCDAQDQEIAKPVLIIAPTKEEKVFAPTQGKASGLADILGGDTQKGVSRGVNSGLVS
jgi:hypothetical protein